MIENPERVQVTYSTWSSTSPDFVDLFSSRNAPVCLISIDLTRFGGQGC